MSFAHTLARISGNTPITVGRAHAPASHTLNFGETVSVVLTTAQLSEAVAAIQAVIDDHMAAAPPPQLKV